MVLVNCLIRRFVFYDASRVRQVREIRQQSHGRSPQPPLSTAYDLGVAHSGGWHLAPEGLKLGALESFHFSWVSRLILAEGWLVKIWGCFEEALYSWNSSTWPLVALGEGSLSAGLTLTKRSVSFSVLSKHVLCLYIYIYIYIYAHIHIHTSNIYMLYIFSIYSI